MAREPQSPHHPTDPAPAFAPLARRDWSAILVLLGFVALNFYLWSLPISQLLLFLISLPLSAAAFAAFLRYAMRE
jgi:hypothetical protein